MKIIHYFSKLFTSLLSRALVAVEARVRSLHLGGRAALQRRRDGADLRCFFGAFATR